MAEENNSVKVDTEYVVLRRTATDTWSAADRLMARDANAAIRKTYANFTTLNQLDEEPVETFIAIPARSFNPVTVRPKVETMLVLEDAS